MFGLGFGEILVIVIIGLLVIGPEKLPSFIKEISNILYKFRRSWNNVKYEIQDGIDNLVEKEDMKKIKDGMQSFKKITDTGSASFEKLIGKDAKQKIGKTVNEIKKIALESQIQLQEKKNKTVDYRKLPPQKK